MAMKQLRVLVVDDSPTVRAVIARKLDESPQINVIGRAEDGLEALELVRTLKPDVITLDVEMPKLDGLQTLERLMEERPTPVIMVSSLTREGADATIRALELGAVDFIEKPVYAGVAAPHAIVDELIDKVLVASKARLRPPRPRGSAAAGARPSGAGAQAGRQHARGWLDRTIVIGASTGGPQALAVVMSALPENFGVPILIVQHTPPRFTRSLAERLDGLSHVSVREARPGSRLEAGVALMAPGGFHLTVDAQGVCSLNEDEVECGVRPAVNVTVESVARTRGRRVVVAILTGMGHDGLRGAQLVHEAGGQVLAESEESCTIYGMPRAVVEAGLADSVVRLDEMADRLTEACRPAMLRKAG